MFTSKIVILLILSAFGLSACDDQAFESNTSLKRTGSSSDLTDDSDSTASNSSDSTAGDNSTNTSDNQSENEVGNNAENSEPKTGLTFELVGLEHMSGQHYEGWVVSESSPLSTGRFTVSNKGHVYSVNPLGQLLTRLGDTDNFFMEMQELPSNLESFILTIEPNGDTDPGPSGVHYLAGDFNNKGQAVARSSHEQAIDAGFGGVSGSYILATPTNGPTTHNQGIWYLRAGQPTLVIPELAEGWAYEGWVVNTDTGIPTSTGIFFTAAGADQDGPGLGAGPNPAPPFPGQDFIDPAKVLNEGNYRSVITVEPHPDFDPKPFTIKILADLIALDAPVVTPLDLNNIANDQSIYMKVKIK